MDGFKKSTMAELLGSPSLVLPSSFIYSNTLFHLIYRLLCIVLSLAPIAQTRNYYPFIVFTLFPTLSRWLASLL